MGSYPFAAQGVGQGSSAGHLQRRSQHVTQQGLPSLFSPKSGELYTNTGEHQEFSSSQQISPSSLVFQRRTSNSSFGLGESDICKVPYRS